MIVAAFPAENKLMKDGTEISAWNTQADGKGVSYMPSDEIEVSDSIVLYAQFDIVEGIQDGVDEQSDQSILKSVLALGKNNNEQNTVNTASEAHTHNEITFSEWTSTNSLPSEGNYYLTGDVTLSSSWRISSGIVSLCLNGKKIMINSYIAGIIVEKDAKLNLYDEANAGTITNNTNGSQCEYGGVYIIDAKFNMWGYDYWLRC